MAYVRKCLRDNVRRVLLVLLNEGGEVHELDSDPLEAKKVTEIFLDEDGYGYSQSKMRRVLRSLSDKGFVEVKWKNSGVIASLTEAGRLRALRYKVDEINIEVPAWWDHRWRIVMFDVPESHKRARDLFKEKLMDLGFVQLQNSVYVHPAESHNEIEFIRTTYGIKDYVKILLVDRIEGELALRKHFGL
ncbi:MAG: CRISPR-associated endonuclease Cas2 [bacterium]